MSVEDPTIKLSDLLIDVTKEKRRQKLAFPATIFLRFPGLISTVKKSSRKGGKRAQRQPFREPTTSNVEKFKHLRVKPRYMIKQQKQSSWDETLVRLIGFLPCFVPVTNHRRNSYIC